MPSRESSLGKWSSATGARVACVGGAESRGRETGLPFVREHWMCASLMKSRAMKRSSFAGCCSHQHLISKTGCLRAPFVANNRPPALAPPTLGVGINDSPSCIEGRVSLVGRLYACTVGQVPVSTAADDGTIRACVSWNARWKEMQARNSARIPLARNVACDCCCCSSRDSVTVARTKTICR